MQEKHGGIVSGPLDLRLWIRLLSCTMQIEKRLRRNFAQEFDTTLPRFDVMASLDRHPEGQTMGELSRALLVSNGNVTAIVKQLEVRKLVNTRVDAADRRSAIVALTPRGKRQFAEMALAHHQWIKDCLAGFSSFKQRELFHILGEMKQSIAKEGH